MTDNITLRKAAQQALEALEGWEHCDEWVWPVSALEQSKRNTTESLAALKAALKQPPPLVQEPVAMRMPKVGDKVICLEDESLGEVVSLTAGGSPDIKFADGSHGTYLLREFAELFGYVNSHQQQAEPLAWDKTSASFDEWWDSDLHDNANPFDTDSFAYWAWEGWQAALAQRPWQGLTKEYLAQIDTEEIYGVVGNHTAIAMAVEAKLKELNK